jgi:capsular exopolysaccharide synthesis family protein
MIKPDSHDESTDRSRMRESSKPLEAARQEGPGVHGVPLARLIKRELIVTPEIVMRSDPRSATAERFRRLKTTLHHTWGDELRVVIVTSSAPGEGKTTVAWNLALAFAGSSSEKTLLIDADLRKPTAGERIRPSASLGLSEILSDKMTPEQVTLEIKDSPLCVLPGGATPPDPLDLLSSNQARSFFEEVRAQYWKVIVDTPPLVPFADADALGAFGDGFLIVVRSGVTPRAVYRQGVAAVTSARILGTVLNDSRRSVMDGSRYYESYYDRYYSREKKRR